MNGCSVNSVNSEKWINGGWNAKTLPAESRSRLFICFFLFNAF